MSVFPYIVMPKVWLFGCLAVILSAVNVYAESHLLTVITSVPPHAFVVEQLVDADQVRVISLVDQGSDPHTYEPTPKQILAISQASIYFAGGLEFERALLAKISSLNKGLSVVYLSDLEDSDHEHPDQHPWLSPILYSRQVRIIFDTLQTNLPGPNDGMGIRYDHFKEKLSKTQRQVRKTLEPYKGRVFYVFHPAFGYFGEAHGIKQKAVELEGKRPTARQLQAIIKRSKADMVKVIFSQPQFDQRSAAVVAAAIGGEIMVLDPLAKDVLANYLTIAGSFVKAFQ